ncbi:MAG TPA: hypothetical protein VFE55_12305 [Acidimicrobiia bacterium]|nr:hypothetical protein [Acidimicrobiia bacterium]
MALSGPEDLSNLLPPTEAHYGQPAPFAEGHRLRFPDFEVAYVGREVDPVRQQETWLFRVVDARGDQTIKLHTGGVLSPEEFTATDIRFAMSLVKPLSPCAQLIVNRLD